MIPDEAARTNINITPNGMFIAVPVAPGTSLNIFIDENTCNEAFKLWIQSRKSIHMALEVVKQ